MSEQLKRKALFNAQGDTDVRQRRMINGNTTNLNDFNTLKYGWVSDWYRQAMNKSGFPRKSTSDRISRIIPSWNRQ